MRALHRGVTLIEACVTTAVAAVVFTSAAPSFHSFIEKQRLDGAAAQLANDLQFSRAEAVVGNHAVRLSVYTVPWGSCYVIHTGRAMDCACSEAGPATCVNDARELKTVQWTARDSVSLQSNVSSILFDPLHGTATPSGTLRVVAASGRVVHQVVNVMGRVRTCSPSTQNAQVPGYRNC